MFGPTRGFSGMADAMEPCKMLWSRPLLLWRSSRLPACLCVSVDMAEIFVSVDFWELFFSFVIYALSFILICLKLTHHLITICVEGVASRRSDGLGEQS